MPPLSTVTWRVAVGGDGTSAVYQPALREQSAVFVCAHGAGGHMHDRGMANVSEALRSVGFGMVRFNFLYREKKSGRPDSMPRLKECLSAVVGRVRDEIQYDRLIIGGRSMGGRAASMLAADGFACDGLLLLAYPLHPAGKPEQLRDAHLPAISVPVLALSGTRDALCRRDLMEDALTRMTAPWTMHWLEGADHGFHVLKSSHRTDLDILQEVAATAKAWIADLPMVSP